MLIQRALSAWAPPPTSFVAESKRISAQPESCLLIRPTWPENVTPLTSIRSPGWIALQADMNSAWEVTVTVRVGVKEGRSESPQPVNERLVVLVVLVGGGGVAALGTADVSPDVAVAEPAEFVALTDARSIDPASALVMAYDDPVARVVQELELEHRCHSTENVIGVEPAHEPLVADSVLPTAAVPLTEGAVVTDGGVTETTAELDTLTVTDALTERPSGVVARFVSVCLPSGNVRVLNWPASPP